MIQDLAVLLCLLVPASQGYIFSCPDPERGNIEGCIISSSLSERALAQCPVAPSLLSRPGAIAIYQLGPVTTEFHSSLCVAVEGFIDNCYWIMLHREGIQLSIPTLSYKYQPRSGLSSGPISWNKRAHFHSTRL